LINPLFGLAFGGIYKLVENIYISLFFKIRKPTTTAPIITYVIVLSFIALVSSGFVFGKLEDIIFGVFEYGVDVGIKIVFGAETGLVLGKVLGGRITVGPLTGFIGILGLTIGFPEFGNG
jgi:hypothetical protein